MKKKEKQIIHRSLDRELNKEETRFLRRKILKDSSQRQEYEGLKEVVDQSKKVLKVRPSDVFVGRVVKEIRGRKKKS